MAASPRAAQPPPAGSGGTERRRPRGQLVGWVQYIMSPERRVRRNGADGAGGSASIFVSSSHRRWESRTWQHCRSRYADPAPCFRWAPHVIVGPSRDHLICAIPTRFTGDSSQERRKLVQLRLNTSHKPQTIDMAALHRLYVLSIMTSSFDLPPSLKTY